MCTRLRRTHAWLPALAAGTLFLSWSFLVSGCGGPSGSAAGGSASDGPTSDTDGTTTTTDEPGTDGTTANFQGVLSGTLSQSRSTRESFAPDDQSAAQTVPLGFVEADTSLIFEDLTGDPLLDENGDTFPLAPVDASGSFTVENLPVGVDFVVAVDLDGDGESDISQVVEIPVDDAGNGGHIDNVVVDPLTTMIVARLREVLAEHGVTPRQLGISPTVVVHRIVDAYVHLFEEAGIDQTITLDDIAQLNDEDMAALFDAVVPPVVRTGMDTVEGNLALERAAELEEVVRAAAEVFLRAGFPIMDGPGPIDLSLLGELPDVEVMTMDMFGPPHDMMEPPSPPEDAGQTLDGRDGADEFPGPLPGPEDDGLFGPGPAPFMPMVYVSVVTEPDRNFVIDEETEDDARRPHLPVLDEHLLVRMAQAHLEGRIITLGNLYRLLTDFDVGLGVRLTYMTPPTGPNAPPMMVFESSDGQGVIRDIQSAMSELMRNGLLDPTADFEELLASEQRIREIVRDLLSGTVPPSFDRLFGTILSDRVTDVSELFRFIREGKVHLPFSRSGPATFYVVADGDRYRPDAGEVHPVSVDLELGPDGRPIKVTYNPTHTGRYFLTFTHETETDNRVELLVRETGRRLHGPRGGPIMLDMGDPDVFDPIDGRPFADSVSEEGVFWPGLSVPVANPEFRMDVGDVGADGPTMQIFVLADVPGPDGQPVIVDYDIDTGTFSYNPDGRFYVAFLPETHDEGLFGLYDINLGFMATVHDLTNDFFVSGPKAPTDGAFPPPPDGEVPPPPEGDVPPPPDGDFPPPPDGEAPPPPDGEIPPPPDGGVPPDGGDSPPLPPPVVTDGLDTGDGSLDTGTVPPPPDGDVPPPPDGDVPPPPDGDVPPPPDGTAPPPPDGGFPPPPGDGFEPPELARIAPADIIGLSIEPEYFRFVYGAEVPNENFDPAGNPYFDDANGNGVEDVGEATADFRPTLFNPDDWRSTDISRYYRRADGSAVTMEDVDFESDLPQTRDGEALVARSLLPRLNAFRFGRPNSAINLLTTFLPPDFFDGVAAIDENTELGVFQAVATINMVMEQYFNVEAVVDIDGDGPHRAERMLMDAHLFVLPVRDPFVLLVEGFEALSQVRREPVSVSD